MVSCNDYEGDKKIVFTEAEKMRSDGVSDFFHHVRKSELCNNGGILEGGPTSATIPLNPNDSRVYNRGAY